MPSKIWYSRTLYIFQIPPDMAMVNKTTQTYVFLPLSFHSDPCRLHRTTLDLSFHRDPCNFAKRFGIAYLRIFEYIFYRFYVRGKKNEVKGAAI